MKKVYLFSIGYSIFGSLGLLCLFQWFCMAAFHERYLYPYLYPFCIIVGIISLFACISIFAINFNIIKNTNKILKTVLKEILIISVTFIPMLGIWNCILNIAGNLF